ncbi:hypothetical protein AZE42_10726 [Rhizopogon vesiculosus]|uniref:Uncharacterized protein n=1 Tax=Rhizopogon vesiculosus TaxID=180088 RepID=A0A1J8PYB7_9AGAM|nr:hypothetical protein AZE42_10726 [Rhizopogon vesiculosus]
MYPILGLEDLSKALSLPLPSSPCVSPPMRGPSKSHPT